MAYYWRTNSRRAKATGAAAGFILALAAHAGHAQASSHAPHASTGHTADAAGLQSVTVAAGGMTPASWARDLERSARLPLTRCDLGALGGWIHAEGSNPAWHNLLDTTQPEPGSYAVNSVGVQAYTSWREGLKATVATLYNGDYPAVVAALENGQNAQAVADAVASSPWGTGPFGASC